MFDLELSHIEKIYENGTRAVSDFSLSVDKGEFIAFLGPSGCGKSTILRMIAGFEDISAGDLLIRGKRMNDLSAAQRPTAMVFQNYALFPHLKLRDNVGYGLDVRGTPKALRDDKIERMLGTLDLLDFADSKPDRLSGGQRQRAAIARALVIEPDILLLDEPLGALDANLRKAIQNELKILQKQLGVTFIFVTHAQSEALALSDRIVVMNKGTVEQISKPHELYTRPNSEFVARFVGRNAIFGGRLLSAQGSRSKIVSELGEIEGVTNTALALGRNVTAVVPGEAINIELRDDKPVSGGNRMAAQIVSVEAVGTVAHIEARTEAGGRINIDAFGDKYQSSLIAEGCPVWLSWSQEDCTIIPAG
ncbi:ABC transporter ATP-binding protein [Agrobacterium rubi]|uniref:ABC transporter ATP-binding protein n=1 Tax=Agrobacterium rubi TaxID=28099 RepID=UPI00157234B5|nr:ABC transporter ATP-binding protein [Agrobacterium rubi]NTF10580.1 ABC transporter ATP-binding protein [Agrobacterium rubi]NTF22974.1 ABC transporter ATP-binding protein [Agrobacterium rubi]NTF29905.1 ABC transporter ATP-binding protein [Agrobacterium rubi]